MLLRIIYNDLFGGVMGMVLLWFAIPISAQVSQAPEEALETIAEENESETPEHPYETDLHHFLKHPVAINRATREELQQLNLLSDKQIMALLYHRRRYGSFKTIYELKGVDYFDPGIIEKIRPYITLKATSGPPAIKLKNLLKGRQYIMVRYQRSINSPSIYEDTGSNIYPYYGKPYRLYASYRYSYFDRIKAGITAEKDPGEPFFGKLQSSGFDFYSGHIFIRNAGPVQRLVIGDYHLNIGQGLVVWTGFGMGKSPSISSLRKASPTLRPFTSTNENHPFRGMAGTIRLNRFRITLFGAANRIDANISLRDSSGPDILEVSSLQNSGYHRDQKEREDEDALGLKSGGIHLLYRHPVMDVGISAMHTRLSSEYQPKEAPFRKFQFRGNRLSQIGLHYSILHRGWFFFGEAAMSFPGSWAMTYGLTHRLASSTVLSLGYRHYKKDHYALFAKAPGETGNASNERGLYAGLEIRPHANWVIKGYLDLYQHPWLRYQTDAPSSGRDYRLKIKFSPEEGTEIIVQGKHETREKNMPHQTSPVDPLSDHSKSRYRLHFTKRISPFLRFKSRVEWCVFRQDEIRENGYLLLQDLTVDFRIPLQISMRMAHFETDSYQTAIYAYERDVLYAFSVPAYFGRGRRFYLFAKSAFGKHLDTWIRLSYTFKNPPVTSLNVNAASSKIEIKAQVRWKI